MCFPSKRQKDYFADKSTAAPQNGTKGTQDTAAASSQPPPTESPPSIPLEQFTVDEQPSTMAPKIAIVTYSMYGHINTSTFIVCHDRLEPISSPLLVADAILKGIKEAGGSADRYQYVPCCSRYSAF